MYKSKSSTSSSNTSKPFKPPLLNPNRPTNSKPRNSQLLFKYKQLSHATSIHRHQKLSTLSTLIDKWLQISQSTSLQLFDLVNYNDDLIFPDFLATLAIDPDKLRLRNSKYLGIISAAANDRPALEEYSTLHGQDSLYTARDDVGHSVLHAICEKGHYELLEWLLPPHVPSPPGPSPANAPLFSSSLSPTPHLTHAILDAHTPDQRSPLHYAARKGHLDVARALLAYASTRPAALDPATYSRKEVPRAAARAADAIEGRQHTAESVLLHKRTARNRLAQDEAELAGHTALASFLAERRIKSSNDPDEQTSAGVAASPRPRPSPDTQKQEKRSDTAIGDAIEANDPVDEAKELMR
ncbi:hypothetical protein E3P84_01291 [Wallemia ichthyophaga]|nr:hypothetical protein E3P84_01291 [Wallemia ichthyophaga]TIB42563.1 hypothetical protein E3P83_01138 [Wallemia ichthyophaga]